MILVMRVHYFFLSDNVTKTITKFTMLHRVEIVLIFLFRWGVYKRFAIKISLCSDWNVVKKIPYRDRLTEMHAFNGQKINALRPKANT